MKALPPLQRFGTVARAGDIGPMPNGCFVRADEAEARERVLVARVEQLTDAIDLLGDLVAAHERQWRNIASFKLTEAQHRNRARIRNAIEDATASVRANAIASKAAGMKAAEGGGK